MKLGIQENGCHCEGEWKNGNILYPDCCGLFFFFFLQRKYGKILRYDTTGWWIYSIIFCIFRLQWPDILMFLTSPFTLSPFHAAASWSLLPSIDQAMFLLSTHSSMLSLPQECPPLLKERHTKKNKQKTSVHLSWLKYFI